MRITLRLLGLTLLDLDVNEDSAADEYDDPGSVTSYPIGFVATHELPDEVGLPDRYADE